MDVILGHLLLPFQKNMTFVTILTHRVWRYWITKMPSSNWLVAFKTMLSWYKRHSRKLFDFDIICWNMQSWIYFEVYIYIVLWTFKCIMQYIYCICIINICLTLNCILYPCLVAFEAVCRCNLLLDKWYGTITIPYSAKFWVSS